MKLSFAKTIEGHEIEFVRLMYPLRYNIFLRVVDDTALKLSFIKDEEKGWMIDAPVEVPGWINEITLLIQETIELNEADESQEPAFGQPENKNTGDLKNNV
jgi:hypothetical protein